MGHGALDLVRAVAATADPGRVRGEAFLRELCAAYQGHYAAQPAALTTVFADGSTALPELRKAGIRVGVCTNKSTHLAEEVLRAVGLGETVEVMLGRDAVEHPKPDPRHLLKVLDKLGLTPEETVYVGDNPIDLDLATCAGVRYRHVAWGVPVDDGVALLSRFDDLIPHSRRSTDMPPLSQQDQAKKAVGIAAVDRYVRPGMLLGLGSGTTSRWFVRALGAAVANGLEVRGVPTSKTTNDLAKSLGIPLVGFDEFDRLDLVVDGPDEIDHYGNMIKGGGASLLWERIVADAADRYVVIADSGKLRDQLGAFPLPIEVIQYGWESTTRSINRLLHLHDFPSPVPLVRRVSNSGSPVITDSGNFIADAHLHSIPNPTVLDRELNWIPGVVENGMFTGLADEVLFANTSGALTVMNCNETPAARPTTTPHGLRHHATQ